MESIRRAKAEGRAGTGSRDHLLARAGSGRGRRGVGRGREYIAAVQGDTDIFITPGYRFRVVERLLTNFHLPRSTLLMLVAAFGGLENIRNAYQHAINRYRFFSYGDAMLIERGS